MTAAVHKAKPKAKPKKPKQSKAKADGRKVPKIRVPKVPRRGRYWAGEMLNFEWQEKDVIEFIQAYADLIEVGLTGPGIIADLSKLFKRPAVEVVILIIDLGERGFISPDMKDVRQIFTLED